MTYDTRINSWKELLQQRYILETISSAKVGFVGKAKLERNGVKLPGFIRCGNKEQLLKQYRLLQHVKDNVLVPDVLDFFEEGEGACLMTNYLSGDSLDKILPASYLRRNWQQLSGHRRRLLMDYLYQAVGITGQLHQLGLVHGKLRPDKFMVQDGKVYLVDLASATMISAGNDKGIADDVYCIGLLMIHFLSNYLPFKLDISKPARLFNSLLYLVADRAIVQLTVDCLSNDAVLRPGVEDILKTIDAFMVRIAAETNDGSVLYTAAASVLVDYEAIIRQSLRLPVNAEGPYNPVAISDWQSGGAGLNYVTARCTLADVYFREIDISQAAPVTGLGLYEGLAGVAVALAATENNQLDGWFVFPEAVDIARGAAGQGIAALHVSRTMEAAAAAKLAGSYVNYLLERQLPNGSWQTEGHSLGIDNGVAGITSFLWRYYAKFPDETVKSAVARAMQYLMDQPIPEPMRDGVQGLEGSILTSLWAFEVTMNSEYQQYADRLLHKLPVFWQTSRFGLRDGYAGMGEMYLEAWRILKNYEWKKRATLLFNELMHVNKQFGNGYYWITDNEAKPNPGLLNGNAGILHFLMRYIAGAEVIPHWLLPK